MFGRLWGKMTRKTNEASPVRRTSDEAEERRAVTRHAGEPANQLRGSATSHQPFVRKSSLGQVSTAGTQTTPDVAFFMDESSKEQDPDVLRAARSSPGSLPRACVEFTIATGRALVAANNKHVCTPPN